VYPLFAYSAYSAVALHFLLMKTELLFKEEKGRGDEADWDPSRGQFVISLISRSHIGINSTG